ncbi:MAG: NAD(P)-dependent oxidoreductase [Chloroflexota bacterium]|nr:NAD(P)-dependent oxidoreductase [Chloroflexota bacterium]
MSTRVGVVGLGAMGLPMSRRLLQNGYEVSVVPHRNTAPAEELAALGATVLRRPADLAHECEVVITSVPDVPQVQEILFGGEGLISAARDGLLFIDMSTITPTAAREHYDRLREKGISALDAPVSGGPTRAADGTLTIMVGGDTGAFEWGLPVLQVLGKNITHVGPAGSGQAVKLVNQLMISIIMVANAEALTLGVKAGVPLKTMLEVIGTSSGSNYLMQNWMTKTLFNDDLKSGFALDLLMKDLRAALSWAGELGLPTFGGAMSQQLYKLARTEETARLDYSVVASIYEEAAGVKLRLDAEVEQ